MLQDELLLEETLSRLERSENSISSSGAKILPTEGLSKLIKGEELKRFRPMPNEEVLLFGTLPFNVEQVILGREL